MVGLLIAIQVGQLINPPQPKKVVTFSTSLADAIYQEKGWVSANLDHRDKSMIDDYDQVVSMFKGHRHDQALLKSLRIAFKKSPSTKNAFREAVGILAFMGLPFGQRASYANGHFEYGFGMREYFDLARSWPKSPSPIQYKVRTELYAIIGGNIDLRLIAVKKYSAFDPKDDEMMKLKLSVLSYACPTYIKLNPEEIRSIVVKAGELYKRHVEQPAYTGLRYSVTAWAADMLKDRSLSKEAIEFGEQFVSEISKDKVDSFDKDGIQAAIKKRKRMIS